MTPAGQFGNPDCLDEFFEWEVDCPRETRPLHVPRTVTGGARTVRLEGPGGWDTLGLLRLRGDGAPADLGDEG